ncbi:MAG: DUF2079 domain-containing protein [Thermoplasmata archaeon]|nr:DUF2079 domain-containing protein [Thermoplasmata archaeon]
MSSLPPSETGAREGDAPTARGGSSGGPFQTLVRIPWLPPAILLAGVFVFAAAWTWIGWLRFQSLHLFVLDFGLIYQEIWATAHGQSPTLIGSGAVHPMVFLLVPFLGLFPSQSEFFLFLLGVNSGAVALAAVPIYLIVRDRFESRWLALGLGLAYLAFPAVAGSVWFPVHLESLFPVLFLTGYWQYRRQKFRVAGLLWTAAILTNIGAPILVAFFGLGLLLEPQIARFIGLHRSPSPATPAPWRTPRRLLGLYLLGASTAVFLAIAAYLASFEGTGGVLQFLLQVNGSGSSVGPPATGGPLALLGRQVMTVVLLLAPLLGLPLLGREERWMLIPYVAHAAFLGSSTAFLWPFTDQYFCYVVPALFASAIRGLDRPWRLHFHDSRIALVGEPAPRARWLRVQTPAARWGAAAVLGVILVGFVFAPWGPANPALTSVYGLAQGSYDFPRATTAYPGGVDSVRSLIGITPASGNLLVQNNLVEPLDRQQFTIPGYHTLNQPISYVLTDPYDSTFYTPNFYGPDPVSMLRWANYYLATGASPVGEADGALLLSTNHSSQPPLYRPLMQYFGPSAFGCCGSERLSNVSSPTQLVSGPTLPVQGNYSVWSPGNFTLVVALQLDQLALTNVISLFLSYGGGSVPFASFPMTGSNASANGLFFESFGLHIPVYLPLMHLALVVQHWTGTVQFEGVWLNQTAPISAGQLGPPWSAPP